MARLQSASTARGPTILALGLALGLAWPALSEATRPAMGAAIFVLLVATLLRVETAPAKEAARRPLPLLALSAFAIVGCPLLAVSLATATAAGLPADMTVALGLALAAPPSAGTATLAWMLGLDGSLALVVTLAATVLTPLGVSLLAPVLPGLAIDPLALAAKLAMLIGGSSST